jgi:hypothetical protein
MFFKFDTKIIKIDSILVELKRRDKLAFPPIFAFLILPEALNFCPLFPHYSLFVRAWEWLKANIVWLINVCAPPPFIIPLPFLP